MTANGRLEKDATTVGFAASPVSSPLKLNVRAYMRQVLLFVVLVINIQCAVAGQLPCLAGDIEETILISLPGYDNEVGLKGAEGEQARLNAAVSSCIRGYRICLLTIDGKMLKANSLSEISVKGRSIVWGVNQILATKNRPYCVTAFVAGPTEDIGPWWTYRTFTPNGGWMDEEMPDEPGLPKTSTQFFQKTSQSFQLFLTRIRETLAEPSFKDGEYGYRVGEEP